MPYYESLSWPVLHWLAIHDITFSNSWYCPLMIGVICGRAGGQGLMMLRRQMGLDSSAAGGRSAEEVRRRWPRAKERGRDADEGGREARQCPAD